MFKSFKEIWAELNEINQKVKDNVDIWLTSDIDKNPKLLISRGITFIENGGGRGEAAIALLGAAATVICVGVGQEYVKHSLAKPQIMQDMTFKEINHNIDMIEKGYQPVYKYTTAAFYNKK